MLSRSMAPKMAPNEPRFCTNDYGHRRTVRPKFPPISLPYRVPASCREGTNGAQERTRTSTPFRAPPPEDGASTNSATWARGRARPLEGAACAVNWDERPVRMPSSTASHAPWHKVFIDGGPATMASAASHDQAHGLKCGCSSMVEQKLPKLTTRVRFPSPAPS